MFTTQIVSCNNNVLDTAKLNIGVSQDSILGPIVFLLYINDLTQHSNGARCNLFADDPLLYVFGKSVDEVNLQLQNCIDSVPKWYDANKLTLNVSKFNIMLLSSRRSSHNIDPLNIDHNGVKLKQVSCVKYLVSIDEHLTWNRHVKNLCTKVAQKLKTLITLIHEIKN